MTEIVYTLAARKAKDNSDLIVGTCYMHEQSLFILFDYRATRSFISTRCVSRLGLEVVQLLSPTIITTTIDDSVDTTRMCKSFLITANDCTFLINLIFLPFKKICVVLGMDWISSH